MSSSTLIAVSTVIVLALSGLIVLGLVFPRWEQEGPPDFGMIDNPFWLEQPEHISSAAPAIVPHHLPPVDLSGVERFVLYLSFGSNWTREYEALKIDSTGKGEYAIIDYRREQLWTRRFVLTKEAIRAIRDEIVRQRIGELYRSYIHPRIADGTQAGVTIVVGDTIRRTYFSNYFPSGCRQLYYTCVHNAQLDRTLVRRRLWSEFDPEMVRAVQGFE